MRQSKAGNNRLANESSPYLQQHADNPVDWYPWNSEALETARQLDKPILLLIGYSACHWCHVMAHECFENEAIAEVMNRLFINIKVDREERPDLDKIYQNAHQLLNQRGGGWPLNVFLPPDERHGMPPFSEVLERVAEFFHQQRQDIEAQHEDIVNALASFNPSGERHGGELTVAPLDQTCLQLASQYDPTWGGFGQAPKFPHPSNLERLFRHWQVTKARGEEDEKARDMVLTTLHAMASGGVYDQLAGGFYRYSVDEKWMIPHFEKMLYDNGPLLSLYTQAWAIC